MLTKTAIEPVVPTQRLQPLEDLACAVLESAARLSAMAREPLRTQLAELTRWMHCYYSNLIEGQQTSVRDIEAALKQDFATEPEKRDLQRLSLAHLEVQRWAAVQTGSPHSVDFFRDLHRRFYAALPETMRVATTSKGGKTPLAPGELRDRDVEVGVHVGPPHELMPDLLAHFQRRYESADRSRLQQIIAIGASHHRLAWIHPFRDGNGRVVRLFSDAAIRQLGINGGGLSSLSRGFARNRAEYYERLSNADQERSSTSADDGRGHLSERALWDFCEFTLRTMVDQIAFMERLLDLDGLEQRIEHYVHVAEPRWQRRRIVCSYSCARHCCAGNSPAERRRGSLAPASAPAAPSSASPWMRDSWHRIPPKLRCGSLSRPRFSTATFPNSSRSTKPAAVPVEAAEA